MKKIEKNGEATPLWLPGGSVRAIVFIMAMFMFCVMTYTQYVDPAAFIGIIGAMVAFYFSEKTKKSEVDALKNHIESLSKR